MRLVETCHMRQELQDWPLKLEVTQWHLIVVIEHVGLVHALFGDHVTKWEAIIGYLKVSLLSLQGYIFKANWSDGISMPECNHWTRQPGVR